MVRSSLSVLVALVAVGAIAAGCGSAGAAGSASPGKLEVVAAENFWGSLAGQLGGSKVTVHSIVVNPDADPHSYEPTAADAVSLARARMVILTGMGYDPWASRLLAADQPDSGLILNVGDSLGLTQGDNPHQWYSPSSVRRVVTAIVADLKRLDPKDAGYFNRQRLAFQTRDLAPYRELISSLRARYTGVPIGYSESIFEPLGRALGLRLLTPYSFAKAISEGTDVTAADKQTVDAQAQSRHIKVWVYNSQNVTPDVQRVNQLARRAHIPIVSVTETLSPASATFEQWQVTQLRRLRQALQEATGR